MVRIESLDHTLDAAYRTAQNQEDKFKSSYYAKETDAINLYNYLDQFSIGVADTNPNAKFGTTSHNYIKSAEKRDDSACSKYLKIFTEKNCEKLVGGNAAFAATVFLSTFKTAIDTIDRLNACDSIDGFINYIYHDRNNFSNGFLPDMTQSKLTEGNSKFKGEEVNVARLISLYNEYCEIVLKAKLNENNNHAIGYSSDVYLNYMKSADADIRARFVQISKDRVS